MLIENTLFGEVNKPKDSIELLQEFEPIAMSLHPDGYYLAYSGGKDSDTILQLAIESGVKFTTHYNVTGLDPKEAIIHIKDTRRRLAGTGKRLIMERPAVLTYGPYKGLPANMWRLIVTKMMPPTRKVRYCCGFLKEHGGEGRLTLTGVRWAESNNRKKSQGLITMPKKSAFTRNIAEKHSLFINRSGGVILNNDNDEARKIVETCIAKTKTVLNIIIGWKDEDVWELLKCRNCPYCKLYDQGEDRIGCIGCPNAGGKKQEEEFKLYPHIRALYIRAFERMIEYRNSRGLEKNWKTGEDVMDWWLHATDKEQEKMMEGQIEIFKWMGEEQMSLF